MQADRFENGPGASLRAALFVMTFVQGFGAGICFDVATVKLPTRHHIGVAAYADFARGNDLGNGLLVYPYLVVGGGIVLIALTVAAHVSRQPSSILRPLYVAALSGLGYLGATAMAAPIMWSLRIPGDSVDVLTLKLDHFAYWHAWRTAFQVAAFIALLWALSQSQRGARTPSGDLARATSRPAG